MFKLRDLFERLPFFKKRKHIISRKRIDQVDFQRLKNTQENYPNNEIRIDDITWSDLDMDKVFHQINHTVTSAGEEALYDWLRNPVQNQAEFEKRNLQIEKYDKNDELRDELAYKLSGIEYSNFDFINCINTSFTDERKWLFLYIPLAIINILLLFLAWSNMDFKFLELSMILMVINGVIHYRFLKKKIYEMSVLSYILRMFSFLKRGSEMINYFDNEAAKKIKELRIRLKGVLDKSSLLLRMEGLDAIGDYINIAILLKETSFSLLSHEMTKYKDDLIELYKILGQVDASISVLNYRKTLNYCSKPIFSENDKVFSVTEMYHPLIEKPVSNSISLEKSIVITGSNMSGKSTFLRTIGLNIILAQSICISLSKAHRSDFYRLITSISLNDDIVAGKSYFLSEADAIKRMINYNYDNIPSIVLIDEIFKGTNPIERLAAAVEIMNEFTNGNTKAVVATHDIQILPMLKDYEFKYFTEHVTLDSLDFDYKIRDGIASTKNAIKILEFIRYPKEITERIYKRIDAREQ